jgi:hypothetical protein
MIVSGYLLRSSPVRGGPRTSTLSAERFETFVLGPPLTGGNYHWTITTQARRPVLFARAMATETATVTATITTPKPMPRTAQQQQRRGRHAQDVPRGGGGGGDVGGGRGERDGNGRGGSN